MLFLHKHIIKKAPRKRSIHFGCLFLFWRLNFFAADMHMFHTKTTKRTKITQKRLTSLCQILLIMKPPSVSETVYSLSGSGQIQSNKKAWSGGRRLGSLNHLVQDVVGNMRAEFPVYKLNTADVFSFTLASRNVAPVEKFKLELIFTAVRGIVRKGVSELPDMIHRHYGEHDVTCFQILYLDAETDDLVSNFIQQSDLAARQWLSPIQGLTLDGEKGTAVPKKMFCDILRRCQCAHSACIKPYLFISVKTSYNCGMKPLKHVKKFYFKYERHISSLSLISGFIFDAVSLTRVDLFWDNLWVLAHLLVAAFGIIAINFYTRNSEGDKRVHFWLVILIQFAFGGLLSTFIVFYFRSATLAVSWPFLLVLIAVFVCNEALKKHYTRLVFQITVLFVSIYSFAIFIVPVMVHQIGDEIFVLSGFISLVIIGIFLFILKKIAPTQYAQSRKLVLISVFSIIVIMNVLYFYDIIPPLPLSLKDAGIYHSISRNGDGTYAVTAEELPSWWNFFEFQETVHIAAGDPVYVWSAVFSPTHLNTDIYHVWQYYDAKSKKWVETARIDLPIVGGRDNGFRTYSEKDSLALGSWRVDVETRTGQHIGRISFKVEATSTEPALFNLTK